MRKSKRTIDELTRLAFVWAEEDRLAYADCYPKDTPEYLEALADAKSFREYRMKRWGRTFLEGVLEDAEKVEINPYKKL
jgi:hypothetical protein